MAGATGARVGIIEVVRMTGLAEAKALSLPDGTTHGILQAETNNVRVHRGRTPTATFGTLIIAGEEKEFNADQLKDLRVIEVTASAQLTVTYFGHY